MNFFKASSDDNLCTREGTGNLNSEMEKGEINQLVNTLASREPEECRLELTGKIIDAENLENALNLAGFEDVQCKVLVSNASGSIKELKGTSPEGQKMGFLVESFTGPMIIGIQF